MNLSKKKSLNFNDVNLLSVKPSIVKSREEIDCPANRIIVAPMSAIMGPLFIKRAVQLNLSVPIHRFNTVKEQQILLDEALDQKTLFNSSSILWLCVGLHDYKERIEGNLDILHSYNVGVLLDVANGFHTEVEKCINKIKAYNIENLFTGNIHTFSGWQFLENLESKFIRVGIGNGAACLTTNNTGIGRGQLTIIDEIYYDNGYKTAYIVSDGGIKEPGDACKAFASGADYIMVGSMFSYAAEAECNLNGQGVFYGGASKYAKEKMGLNQKNIEGTGLTIDKSKIQPLDKIVENLLDGIKSCISYCGYTKLDDFIGNGMFELKQR